MLTEIIISYGWVAFTQPNTLPLPLDKLVDWASQVLLIFIMPCHLVIKVKYLHGDISVELWYANIHSVRCGPRTYGVETRLFAFRLLSSSVVHVACLSTGSPCELGARFRGGGCAQDNRRRIPTLTGRDKANESSSYSELQLLLYPDLKFAHGSLSGAFLTEQ